MPNKYYSEFNKDYNNSKKSRKNGGSSNGNKPAGAPKFVERTAAWGDNAGPTQPRDRSLGVARVKRYPKSKGL